MESYRKGGKRMNLKQNNVLIKKKSIFLLHVSNNFVEKLYRWHITRSTNLQPLQAKGNRVATDGVGNVGAAERFFSASKNEKKDSINFKLFVDSNPVETNQVLGKAASGSAKQSMPAYPEKLSLVTPEGSWATTVGSVGKPELLPVIGVSYLA